jgi:hypothetical protein
MDNVRRRALWTTVNHLALTWESLYCTDVIYSFFIEPLKFNFLSFYLRFSLHIGLDPSENVMELGSRSFFLCPKSSALGLAASSPSSNGTNGVTVTEASGKAGETPACLSYMQFWPIM